MERESQLGEGFSPAGADEMKTLKEVLNTNAKRYGDRTALVFEDTSYTFDQVNRRINSLVNALSDLGVQKGDRVGVLAYNCPQCLEVFGLAKAGLICVPLNYRSVGRELTYLVNNSEINTLILGREFVDVVNSIRPQLEAVTNFICLDAQVEGMLNYEQLISSYPADEPPEEVAPEDPAALYYTSGTTGYPKGAIHTHRSLLAEIAVHQESFCTDDVVLCVMPFFHVGGSAAHLFPAFTYGATSVIHRAFDETAVLEAIQEQRITYVGLVPAMIIRLLEHPDLDRYDLSSLSTIMYVGAPMPVEALRKGLERFGPVFSQIFGQTETLNVAVLRKADHKLEGSEREVRRLKSAGKPFARDEMRIVDEKGRDVPLGEAGEILACSDRMMSGYWKMPEETVKTITDGWLHMGDVGMMDEDGYIYLVDRKKDMIISGGENIYSREVEEVLYTHPAVLEAAVVGVPDEKWGESVKAVVVLKEGASASEEEIVDFCKERLAGYKKPRSVDFRDILPKTGSGKIRKGEIREDYWKDQERRIH
ncbi:MAG TPA: long-chain-fatty-acid--CoA ligase [Chloroflexi bacterium]|nr:long-chain-fatty-acid--CoA ligase [Chloroflexota bacterium]